jgi:hypothetical protein
VAVAGLISCLVAAAARAASAAIEDFFGAYEGQSISASEDRLEIRDLAVVIEPRERGFNVKWTTVIHRSADAVDRVKYSIDFEPSRRADVYRSGMRKDMFGNRIPLDPMAGDPYVWARIRGRTLSVFALVIVEDGGFEMQVYDRTLTPTGLDLEFHRMRDGTEIKRISGRLKKMER